MLRRHIPGHKATVYSSLAGVEHIALLALSLQNGTAALGAATGHTLHNGLGIGASGEARASQEGTETADLHNHVLPADLTDLIGNLIGNLDPLAFQSLFRFDHLCMEALIEVPQNLFPLNIACFYFVKLLLHVSGEFHIDHIVKAFDHKIRHHDTQWRGRQTLVLLDHIITILDGSNDRSIGRRTTYSTLLHCLNQSCFRISCGRGGKMLFLPHFLRYETLRAVQIGQSPGLFFFVIVPTFFIHSGEACKLHDLLPCAEHMSCTGGIDLHRVIHCISHLASHETAPNQLIQTVLFSSQVILDPLRIQVDITGTNGFMGVLCPFLLAEATGRAVIEALTVTSQYEVLCAVQSFLRQAQGVGSHIGNQTHSAFPGNVNAFIELLGNGHSTARSHIELTGSLLLESRGNEGRGGAALLLGALNRRNSKLLPCNICKDLVDLIFAVELPLLAVAVIPSHKATGLVHATQIGIQGPVFLGNKGLDLSLPFHHQTGGYRLHTARRQTSADLLPQQWAELIAYNAVQDPSSLLSIYQIIVDLSGFFNAGENHLFGDLVKGHALCLLIGQAEELLQMPRNGFSLAVRVRCQIDSFCLICSGL